MTDRQSFDGVLVVGSGLAGLSAALAAAPSPVLLLTAGELADGAASAWAQGGIAVALAEDDNPHLHALDTIAAGAGLVDPKMAELLAAEGPEAVRWLASLGAPFDRDGQGRFVQGLEAAHSRPRIAKVKGDQAGFAVTSAIASALAAAPHVAVRERTLLRGLLQDASGRVRGVVADGPGGRVEITARAVVLATGGVGGLYAVTTNPPGALGQGLALAAVAGAELADPEFVQFHPTAIDVGRDPAPLATEALRGDGAILVDKDGRRFMPDVDPAAELAPRDVVARAIHQQIAQGHGAFLDARQAVGHEFPEIFPTVFAACQAAGVDPRVEPIPVAPAAHYHMGGVRTDAEGRTSLPGLYAAGECASTGVHGANRLASNSLLEAVVFGRRAGRAAACEQAGSGSARGLVLPDLSLNGLRELRGLMSRHAGVVRDRQGLQTLLEAISRLDGQDGAAGALVVCRLIAAAALAREESRGGHFRADFPAADPSARRTFLHLDRTDAAAARARNAA
jgi:L-aspartate oxidase